MNGPILSSLGALRLALVSLLCSALLIACNEEHDSTTSVAGSSAPAIDQAHSANQVATAEAIAAARTDCPAGKWQYDYSDRYLESIVEKNPGMKVVKEKGRVICTIGDAKNRSYVCTTSAGGVENVFKAQMTGGMTITVSVKITGSSTAQLESAGANRWKVTSADLSGLNVETKANLNGKEIPFPVMDLFPGLDKTGGILEYQCQGDTLKWKPQLANELTPEWATLTRLQ